MIRPGVALGLCLWLPASAAIGFTQDAAYRSPVSIGLSPDGARAYVVNHSADLVSEVDVRGRRVTREFAVGPRPACAVATPDGRAVLVSALHGSAVRRIDLASGKVEASLNAGWEPWGLAVSGDGGTVVVANALSDSVSILQNGIRTDVAVGRAPRSVALMPDRSRVVVANGLGRSATIVDVRARRVVETRSLGHASLLRGTVCTPDGAWAVVAHVVSRDDQVPLQIERGWIHGNGITFLDLRRPGRRVTLLLDGLLKGAASPWDLALARDGRTLFVSLAGTHEVAIVDMAKAVSLVKSTPPERVKALEEDVQIVERLGIARRVPSGGLGPRGLALNEVTGDLLVCNYFSDSVAVLDPASGALRAEIPLGPRQAMTEWRRGELAFNDARLTVQGWFSCASCHQEDATIDALNWDLPNDGVGNPKSVKSLHDIHDTPPAMWSGVRDTLDAAVAAGQRFQGFAPDPDRQRALLAYLSDPPIAPNPWPGLHPEAARRGGAVFDRAGCAGCHPTPRYTDQRAHDIGLVPPRDPHGDKFDTPSLRECYRTAPYLHDGRAATLLDVFTVHDPLGWHRGGWRGDEPVVPDADLPDLVEFLKCL